MKTTIKTVANLSFSWPTHVLVVGQTKSGKTTLAMSIIHANIRSFDYVVLMSASAGLEQQYKVLKGLPNRFYDSIDASVIERILERQKKTTLDAVAGRLPRPISMLLVLDDTSQFSFYSGKLKECLNRAFKSGRQWFLSILLLSQSLSGQIPPGIHGNCPWIFATYVSNGLVDLTFSCTQAPSKTAYREFLFKNCKARDTCVLLSAEDTDLRLPLAIKYYKI